VALSRYSRLVGLVLFAAILYVQDWNRIESVLLHVDWPWFAGFWAFFFVTIALRVERTRRAAARCGTTVPFSASYRIIVETSFLGTVTPGRIGELSKIGYLMPFGMSMGVSLALVLLERVYDVLALLVFGISSILLAARRYPQLLEARKVVIEGLILAAALAVFASAVARHAGVRSLLWRTTGWLFRGRLTRQFSHDLLFVQRRAGFVCVSNSALWVVCNVVAAYTLARALRIPVGPSAIGLSYTASTVFSALPVSVAGLGTREAAHILILGWVGVAREQALLLSLLDGLILPLVASGAMMLPLLLMSGAARPADSANPFRLVLSSIQKRGWFATAKYIVGELSFDWIFRAETRTPVAVENLVVTSDSKAYACTYQGTGWFLLKRLFHSLIRNGRLDPQTTCLIDFGSGKGRVLLAALHFEIGRVIGVEFDPQLCSIARSNLSRYAGRKTIGKTLSWEVVHGDVLDFRIPEEANLFFLYNPFHGRVLEEVAARIHRACTASSGDCLVVYVNPIHDEIFRRLGFAPAADSDSEVAIYSTKPNSVRCC
jgi:uncharacterized membrane protein YbhN (UPF0104 family)